MFSYLSLIDSVSILTFRFQLSLVTGFKHLTVYFVWYYCVGKADMSRFTSIFILTRHCVVQSTCFIYCHLLRIGEWELSSFATTTITTSTTSYITNWMFLSCRDVTCKLLVPACYLGAIYLTLLQRKFISYSMTFRFLNIKVSRTGEKKIVLTSELLDQYQQY